MWRPHPGIHDLGLLQIETDGIRVPLKGRLVSVLAILLTNADETVTVDAFEQRGTHFANAGQYEAAIRCYGAAAESEREGRSWPRHSGTPERLERLREALSPAAYQRNWESGQRLGRSQPHHSPEDWS